MLLNKMTKNVSIFVMAAVAGILVAGALAVAMPTPVRADQVGGSGGIGGAGGAGGVAGNGGANADLGVIYNHQSANGGDANGGNGGQANGGNICNHVKAIKARVGGELCGSS